MSNTQDDDHVEDVVNDGEEEDDEDDDEEEDIEQQEQDEEDEDYSEETWLSGIDTRLAQALAEAASGFSQANAQGPSGSGHGGIIHQGVDEEGASVDLMSFANFVNRLNPELSALVRETAGESEASRGEDESATEGASGSSSGLGNVSSQLASSMESDIETFLEFTGSTDRDLALQYLLGSDGKIEQAVNLYLSGAQPDLLSSAGSGDHDGDTSEGSWRVTTVDTGVGGEEVNLPSVVHAHLNALAQRRELSDHGRSNDRSRVMSSQLHAMFSGAMQSSNNSSSRSRNSRSGRSGAAALALRQLATGLGSVTSGRMNAVTDLLSREKIEVDSPERLAAQLDALRSGMWDKAPEIGAACLRKASVTEKLISLGLADVLQEALPMSVTAGEDELAMRLLQVLEVVLRIVCDGHSEAVNHAAWWFIPPRRTSSRRYGRNNLVESFLERVVPESDISALEQLWFTESFDPSWRDRKTEAEMLACSLNASCSIKFLEFLIDPVNGCRANVNPEPDRLGKLLPPLLLAAYAENVKDGTDTSSSDDDHADDDDVEEESKSRGNKREDGEGMKRDDGKEMDGKDPKANGEKRKLRETWSRKAVEMLLDFGASVAEIGDAEFEKMTDSARELVQAEMAGTRVSRRLEARKKRKQKQVISPEIAKEWREVAMPDLFVALLRVIGSSRSETTIYRAMEVLTVFVERLRGVPFNDAMRILSCEDGVAYVKFMELLQSVCANDNDDFVALKITTEILDALLACTEPGEEDEEHFQDALSSEQEDNMLPSEPGSSNATEFYSRLCLNFCRFGVTNRLIELSGIEDSDREALIRRALPSNAVSNGADSSLPTSGNSATNMELDLARHILDTIITKSRSIVGRIRECVVDKLGLVEDTLHGKSPALMNVCERLLQGDARALEPLVYMLGHSPTPKFPPDSPTSDEGRSTVDDGITTFEFERSGLANALVSFLLARDMDAEAKSQDEMTLEELRRSRMRQFLSIMPPPVSRPEDLLPTAPELVDDDEDDDEVLTDANQAGDAQDETSQAEHGDSATGTKPSDDDEGAKKKQESKKPERKPTEHGASDELVRNSSDGNSNEDDDDDDDDQNMPEQRNLLVHTGMASNETESSNANRALRDLTFQFGSDKRSDASDRRDRRSSSHTSTQRGSVLGRMSASALEYLEGQNAGSGSVVPGLQESSVTFVSGSSSALFRLVSKLQAIVTAHSTTCFPVLTHHAPSTVGGVRALVTPIKLKLIRDEQADVATSTYPQTPVLSVQVLPLTPLRELEFQVLRSARLSEPRYVEYCRRLVGRKIVHCAKRVKRMNGSNDSCSIKNAFISPRSSPRKYGRQSSNQSRGSNRFDELENRPYKVGLVLKYDSMTGAHLVQDLSSGSGMGETRASQWYIMALRDYEVLERVMDAPSIEDVKPVVEFKKDELVHGNKDSLIGRKGSASSGEADTEFPYKVGDRVAVWWEGGLDINPGWREGVIRACRKNSLREDVFTLGSGLNVSALSMEKFLFDIEYETDELIFDSVIRSGDFVKLVEDSTKLKAILEKYGDWTPEINNFLGELAQVTNVRGNRINTDGLGGYVFPLEALIKVPPPRVKSGDKRPSEGDAVTLAENAGDTSALKPGEIGRIVVDDLSWRPYHVRLPNGKMRWYRRRDLVLVNEDGTMAESSDPSSPPEPPSVANSRKCAFEENVRLGRICDIDKTDFVDSTHVFAVHISPPNHPSEEESSSSSFPGLKEEEEEESGRSKGLFRLHDRIEARYAGRSRWYRGRIARVNASGTYDIAYDDGDSERAVKSSLICHVGEGRKKVVSYDFRKVFPGSTGRALFDALRRSDSVLNTEYNFVTRGFVHQPKFYATFAETLEHQRLGVFAQFQTRQQAEILYDRIIRASKGSQPRSASASANSTSSNGDDIAINACITLHPFDRPPSTVEHDILAAFEAVAKRNGDKINRGPPPPPGCRAQVQVIIGPTTTTAAGAGVEGEAEKHKRMQEDSGASSPTLEVVDESNLRWVSATIVGKRILSDQELENEKKGKDNVLHEDDDDDKEEDRDIVYTCVLDNGIVLRDVRSSQVRIAQRTSRSFPFKSLERENPMEKEAQVTSPTRTASVRGSPLSSPASSGSKPGTGVIDAEPVELSRQFTAFGQSTSYKHIRVDSMDSAITELDEESDEEGFKEGAPYEDNIGAVARAFPTSKGKVGGTEKRFTSESDEMDENGVMTPPRFEVEFVVVSEVKQGEKDENEKQDKIVIVSDEDGEMSMFQALFQLFHSSENSRTDLTKASGRSSANWDSEYQLQWRCRVMFPEDAKNPEESKSTQELKLPWKTPQDLAREMPNLTEREFLQRMKEAIPNVEKWALENGIMQNGDAMEPRRFSWAAASAAFAQLCRQPLARENDVFNVKLYERVEETGAQKRKNSVICDEPHTMNTMAMVEDEMKAVLQACGLEASGDDAVSNTLLLLKLLYMELVETMPEPDYNTRSVSTPALGSTFAKSLPWRNSKISEHLRNQLADPLSIATRCFPKWCAILPRSLSFLFRTRDRQVHMRCTALGVSRAVAWLQDEVTGYKAKKRQLAQITLEISAMFRGVPDIARYEKLQDMSDRLEDELRAIEQEHCIGQLHQDLVKVNRVSLLRDAELLMRQHMHQRSELVVQFIGETGAGDGVTVDFYASVAAELQRIAVNREVPLWAERIDHGDTVTATEGKREDDGKGTEIDAHLMQSRGLFPQPLLPIGSLYFEDHEQESKQENDQLQRAIRAARTRNDRVVSRFRFLGRLMAKALLDDKHVPLPLSPEFFVLVKNRICNEANPSNHTQLLPMAALSLVEGGGTEEGGTGESTGSAPVSDGTSVAGTDGRGSGIIATLYGLWKRSRQEDWERIESILENIDLRFVDPSQPPLLGTNESSSRDGTIKDSQKEKQEISIDNMNKNFKRDHVATSIEDEDEDGERKEKDDNAKVIENQEVDVAAPENGCGQAQVEAYAKHVSSLGYTQERIEEALKQAGHSKMVRWKALKASQKIRTEFILKRAEEKDERRKQDPSIIASQLELDGVSVPVTKESLGRFLQAITYWWLEGGVVRQADAFRAGLEDVLGPQGSDALLHNFSPSELRRMLCGKQEVRWKEDDPLLGCLVPMGGYTTESKPIKMLVKALKEMTMKERAQFLSFVTSQPRVPLSGLPQIKVYPPMMELVPGIIVKEDDPADGTLHVDDVVELTDSYVEWDDAAHGPLRPGDTGVITKLEGRALVKGWWYNARALRRVTAKPSGEKYDYVPKQEWFRRDTEVRTARARATVESWNPETGTLLFASSTDMSQRLLFKAGQSIEPVDMAETGKKMPVLRVHKVLEQPEAIQMPPYLRPKATTCAKTMYLPDGYEDHKHLLQIFRGAFEDAKLGGIHD